MATNKKIKASKIIKIALMGLFGLLTLSILFGWIFGYKAFIVYGASSEPMVKYGSLAVIRPIDASDVKLGDILSYKATEVNPSPITHRVISVKNASNEVIAEFREKVAGEIPLEWQQNGAYVIERSDLGINVVAWYSGINFDETSIFNTQASNFSTNPFDSNSAIENITYSRLYGRVLLSIPGLGNVVLFIQRNIILVVATFACLFLLYNMIYNELKVKK